MLTARRSEPAARVHDEPAVVDIAIVIPAFNETSTVGPTVDRTRTAMAPTPSVAMKRRVGWRLAR